MEPKVNCKKNDVEMESTPDAEKDFNEASCPVNNSPTVLVQEMENLQLSQEINSNNFENLAGYIKAVIPPTGAIVIQLATESKILDIGTLIFMPKSDDDGELANERREIGFVHDIFGPVSQPMYLIQPKEKTVCDSLHLDSKVFYLPDHPSTKYITVKHEIDSGHYTVIHHSELDI